MGVMDIGSTALRTAYTQLQTTSHNIANASTPGFSRQEVHIQARTGQFSGSGFLGGGVDTMSVERVYSQHLTREVNSATAQHAADEARVQAMTRLDQLFSDPTTGIGAAYDSFTAGLADMVNQPYDMSARTVAKQRASDLAASLNGTDGELARIGDDSNRQISQSVQELNAQLAELATLNQRIGGAAGALNPPNDLLDQRDALIEKINGSIKVSTHINDDRTASLFASTGDALVLKQDAAILGVDADPRDPDRLRLMVKMGNNMLPLKDDLITGGVLAGQLQFHNDDLRAARGRVGQLAAALADGYNKQQAVGVDANGDAGAALFEIGPAQAVASQTNAGGAVLALSVEDARALKPSDYQLERTDTGFTLTRLVDDSVTELATLPATVDGVSLELTGAMATGDSFAIRTGSAFASGFRMVLGSPDEWAAAYPMIAAAKADNTGSVAVSNFAMTAPGSGAASPAVTITFAGDGTLSYVRGAAAPVTGVAFTAGEPIELDGWSMTLSGTPAAGDVVTVDATKDTAADNRNARALLGLTQDGLVDGRPTSEAVGAMVGEIGARSQAATNYLRQSETWQTSARDARDEVSGVNLDEEAARLLQFQQAYQAAAKVISTAQTMFDSLLSIAR